MVVFFSLLFLIAPLCLLLHECGHALLARSAGAERVEVFLGVGPAYQMQVHPSFSIHIASLYFLGAMASYDKQDVFKPGERIAISLGGPLFSLGGAVLSWGSYLYFPHPILSFMIIFNLWLFAVNLIPFKIRGKRSDGSLILQDLIGILRKSS
ncbi:MULTISPECIES: site-2 protease family protein [Pontibacillus]|uniref:Peptidase M50 domain-containing protein n=1 Tax=Pontibacillus chungwhensis TaxID=265426 RepID=A0ABY8UXT1_9BACI|nr:MULTISPECIES: site-2 protease family protein [Pontibacillus]MCD5323054.1 hypothetical protein [Pontibacillus sp. HN14]WIF96446.1 hypothetical protein QNI29_11850 [Pontibacillus chungwhensis]